MLIEAIMGLALAVQPTGAPTEAATVQATEAPIVGEARAFMERYAGVLRAGDRAGIAALYDRRGAHLQGFGGDKWETHAQITAAYRDKWSPPLAFEWHDLRYEALGPETVAVVGRFTWTPAQGNPTVASYTAVLVRREGALRIRVEHESAVEQPPVTPAASE